MPDEHHLAQEVRLRLFQFIPDLPITRYDSTGAAAAPVLRDAKGLHLTWIRLDAGGHLGNHQAVKNQLFIVVSGEGWVQTDPSSKVAVAAGQAAFWQAGEWHTSGTETGMTALVLEGDALDLADIVGVGQSGETRDSAS